jgi:hypothetical protein
MHDLSEKWRVSPVERGKGTTNTKVQASMTQVRISSNVTDHFRNIVTGTFGEAKADKYYTNRSRTAARSARFLYFNHAVSSLRSDGPLSFSL